MEKRIQRMNDLIQKRKEQTITPTEYKELENLVFFFGETPAYLRLIDAGL